MNKIDIDLDNLHERYVIGLGLVQVLVAIWVCLAVFAIGTLLSYWMGQSLFSAFVIVSQGVFISFMWKHIFRGARHSAIIAFLARDIKKAQKEAKNER